MQDISLTDLSKQSRNPEKFSTQIKHDRAASMLTYLSDSKPVMFT
jgi:hypothetical protein